MQVQLSTDCTSAVHGITGQLLQCWEPVTLVKEFVGHCVHCTHAAEELTENLPTGHALQGAMPTSSEYFPAVHKTQSLFR